LRARPEQGVALGIGADPQASWSEPLPMSKRYWLVHPHGGWQLIDPREFDLGLLAEQAKRTGGRLVVEGDYRAAPAAPQASGSEPAQTVQFDPPVLALGHMFRKRLEQIYPCKHGYSLEMNVRATTRVLGGYYKKRRLVRIYTHDCQTGRRPLDELFDTFLHEMAHHIEYTEPESFHARECGRVHGRMHSRLFWLILGDLKARWAEVEHREEHNHRRPARDTRWTMNENRYQIEEDRCQMADE
jgi:hypothetical protein